jgi:hypothetical protein
MLLIMNKLILHWMSALLNSMIFGLRRVETKTVFSIFAKSENEQIFAKFCDFSFRENFRFNPMQAYEEELVEDRQIFFFFHIFYS